MSRRRAFALGWLLASSVPLVLALALLGCCALPFHGLVHRFVPLCAMAEATLIAHHHSEHDGHGDQPATPVKRQDNPDGQRLAWKSEARASFLAPLVSWRAYQLPEEAARRSQLAPSALRCDDDVGTRLALLDTLRI